MPCEGWSLSTPELGFLSQPEAKFGVQRDELELIPDPVLAVQIQVVVVELTPDF